MAKQYCGNTSAVDLESSLPYDIGAANGNQPSTYLNCATTAGTVTYKSTYGGASYTDYLFVGRNPIAAVIIESVSEGVAGLGYSGSNNVYNT